MYGLHRVDDTLSHIVLPPGPDIPQPWGHPHGVWVLHGPTDVALVDTGCATAGPALDAALAELGVAPSDVGRVLLTGYRPEQTGNIERFGRAGVFALTPSATPRATARAAAERAAATARALLTWDQAHEDWTEATIEAFVAAWPESGPERVDAAAVGDGGRVRAAGRVLELVATPGVGPGAAAWWDAARGDLFAGRSMVFHTLPDIDDIDAYTDSLARLTELTPTRVCPAWGGVTRHHAIAFRSLSLHVNNLLSNVQYVIRGRRTAAEVAAGDLGYVPRDLMRFTGSVLRFRAILDGLADAGIVEREGDPAMPVYILEAGKRY